jgi:hypothetical protein
MQISSNVWSGHKGTGHKVRIEGGGLGKIWGWATIFMLAKRGGQKKLRNTPGMGRH